MRSRTCTPGEVIVREGEQSRDLYILTEGTVEITSKDKSGNLVLNKIEPPQIFGEISFLINDEPRTATAMAKTKVEIFVLHYEEMKEQISQLPEWIKPILDTLVKRIKSQDKRIKGLEKEILEFKSQGI